MNQDQIKLARLDLLKARAVAEMNFASAIYGHAHQDPRITAMQFSEDLFKPAFDYLEFLRKEVAV
jgi:hypothetical protein